MNKAQTPYRSRMPTCGYKDLRRDCAGKWGCSICYKPMPTDFLAMVLAQDGKTKVAELMSRKVVPHEQ